MSIIGVQETGNRGIDGAELRHVTIKNKKLVFSGFQPSKVFNFKDFDDEKENKFSEIPIAYWHRNYFNGLWTMLVSDKKISIEINGKMCDFREHPGVFNQEYGTKDKFFFGKYRGSKSGDTLLGSTGGGEWTDVSFDLFKSYCKNNNEEPLIGDLLAKEEDEELTLGYHMSTLLEFHEILARAVIERCTFKLDFSKENYNYKNIYNFTEPFSEYLDGIKATSNNTFDIWNSYENFVNTKCNIPINTSTLYNLNYNRFLLEDHDLLKFIFIQNEPGFLYNSFLPYFSGGSETGGLCTPVFKEYKFYGAFNTSFYLKGEKHKWVGTRLSKGSVVKEDLM